MRRLGGGEFLHERAGFAAEMVGRAYAPAGLAQPRSGSRLLHGFELALTAVLPVLLLVALGAASFLYGDRPAVWFGPETAQWLTLGHLMVPLTFFVIALVNRRYGAGFAFAVTMLAWVASAAVLVSSAADLAGFAGRTLPPLAEAAGFAGGLAVGQILSILLFDALRGPRWFVAPLFAWLFGGAVFVAIAMPLTVPGTVWIGRAEIYGAIVAAAAVAMLLPYWLLRAMVPPKSGFGGY